MAFLTYSSTEASDPLLAWNRTRRLCRLQSQPPCTALAASGAALTRGPITARVPAERALGRLFCCQRPCQILCHPSLG